MKETFSWTNRKPISELWRTGKAAHRKYQKKKKIGLNGNEISNWTLSFATKEKKFQTGLFTTHSFHLARVRINPFYVLLSSFLMWSSLEGQNKRARLSCPARALILYISGKKIHIFLFKWIKGQNSETIEYTRTYVLTHTLLLTNPERKSAQIKMNL